MPAIAIEEKGCRFCSLCHDVCPTNVFSLDDRAAVARVSKPEDCIGCTSCEYICPSRCLRVTDVQRQRPFYRVEENAAIVARFLQQEPVSSALGTDDLVEALRDVAVRLVALGDSVTETMGRGQKVVGRKAGQLAAVHLPDLYEGVGLEAVLARMRARFQGSFDFDAEVAPSGDEVAIRFQHCALASVAEQAGQRVGGAVLCTVFHEYWAGLVGELTGRTYSPEPMDGAGPCSMRLRVRS